jgi:hypothetical protein
MAKRKSAKGQTNLQNILIGTATRGNDQEWTNFKLHEPCEPHGLSSGVCVCCSINHSSLRLLLYAPLPPAHTPWKRCLS